MFLGGLFCACLSLRMSLCFLCLFVSLIVNGLMAWWVRWRLCCVVLWACGLLLLVGTGFLFCAGWGCYLVGGFVLLWVFVWLGCADWFLLAWPSDYVFVGFG